MTNTMIDFKAFLDACAVGAFRHDLFLTPNRAVQAALIIRLFDEANARDLAAVISSSSSSSSSSSRVTIGNGEATFRHVYPDCIATLKGYTLTAVQGLDELDRFDDAEYAKKVLMACVRE